ncbi:MAG TPA: hypothetical protein PLM24_04310 [Methanothrix sp.]|nr:hypothetical protein [Methanothrix sp.]HPJ83656.1 hypothetical protein [Methanothrix sp.]HPR66340.1 hypothetical protein [Methanothrix sp.]
MCGREGCSLFKVKHQVRGKIKICKECWMVEKYRLLPSGGCSCC